MMRVRRDSEAGFLSFSGILGLAFLAAIIFLAIKLLPPYIDNYQFQDQIENLARTATYTPATEHELREGVKKYGRDLGIPL